MTVYNTPDGPVNFPDNMSQDEVKGVLRKKYGGPAAGNGAAPADGSAPPAQQEIAQPDTSLPPLDPRTATAGDYLGRLHQAASGLGQIVSKVPDYARVAANTGGLYDRMAAGARTGGFVQDENGDYVAANDPAKEAAALAEERAKTAAASGRLGTAGTFAANMTGTAPLGMLGVGGKIAEAAEPYIARYGSQMLGRGIEGGAIGGSTAAGRDENMGWGTLIGSLFGLGSGVLGGRGRGSEVPKPTDPAVLEANDAAVRAEMGRVRYNSGGISTAWDDALNGLKSSQRGNISYPMRMKVAQQQAENGRGQETTADTLNGFARKIFDGVKNGDDEVYAAKIRDALLAKLKTARPTSNHVVGYGAQLNDQANAATAALGDSEWLAGTNVNKAPGEAKKNLDPESGNLYTPAGKQAVSDLASFAPKETTPTTNVAAGAVQGAVADAGKSVGSKIGSATLATLFGHPYVGGLILAAKGIKGAVSGGAEAARNARIMRAIDAAKVATSTGRPTTMNDMLPPAPIRDFAGNFMTTQAGNPDYRNRVAPP